MIYGIFRVILIVKIEKLWINKLMNQEQSVIGSGLGGIASAIRLKA
jgi:hypothetical protein